MTLRADHVAGAAFVGFGLLVLLLSGELPVGRLAMPGAGFMPRLIAWLLVGLGALLFLRARESATFAEIGWDDLGHAVAVLVMSAAAAWLYIRFGFVITMFLMIFGLLVLIEWRNPVRAGLYSLLLVFLAFNLFDNILKARMPDGPLDVIVRAPVDVTVQILQRLRQLL